LLLNKISKVGRMRRLFQFTPEQQLENNLIEQLTSGISQWTYRNDLHTEDHLWSNFRQKLEANNTAILKGVPLTSQEFRQVQNQLNFANFYEAARWLSGENGIAKVEVQREDASLGKIRLNVISRQDIAGGTSSYEVINQFKSPKRTPLDQDRRFDVTLLINGLPMIHIELKNRAHQSMDAFRQIRKYLKEGKFTGIYSTTQMFVVTNGTDTRYIASATDAKLNEQFLTKWVDKDNHAIVDYLEFAQNVLSIPMAHKMVTQYTVLDNNRKSLILLRPYQIHAIEAVKKASRESKSGYVWHTTGSGKTLTSYKVAKNLLQIASIDKTIFIVDRKDLDQQTTSSFLSYSEDDVVSIDETENVHDLVKKLLSENRNVIITTIQKLNIVMKRYASKAGTKQYEKLTNLKLAFVVDECHRAVTPQKKQQIDAFFRQSLWYGFTGTPIFAENKKATIGDLPQTTEEQYGECLHKYTVKEALSDNAVLGFQVEYKSTLSEYELNRILQKYKGLASNQLETMDDFEKEDRLPRNTYDSDEHRLEVINSIINKSRSKLGFLKGTGQTYDAILTTNSIENAGKYYNLLMKIKNEEPIVVKNEESLVKISEETKRVLPDFPKIAITYSISENDESSIAQQDVMKKALQNYNDEFGMNFTMETIAAYNRNINERLARKKEKYLARSEQLDLVIVVDRLLTGFDAPCLSTLFIDREPMQPHSLMQAFSRTNRLFDKSKKYGQIVTFQKPKIFEQKVNEALVLYSNGGENYVLAPTWEEASKEFIMAIKSLKKIADKPETTDKLNKAEKKKFVKAFQRLDRAFTAIQVYSDFDEEFLGDTFDLIPEEFEEFHGKYKNILEELRVDPDDPIDGDLDPIDAEYELESVKTEKINYEYILNLIQAFVPSGDDEYELIPKEDAKAVEEVNKYINELSNTSPQLSNMIRKLWNNIRNDPENYRNQNVSNLLEEMIQEVEGQEQEKFVDRWVVKEDKATFVMQNFNPKKERQNGEKELLNSGNYEEYKSITKNPVSRLRYGKEMRKDLTRVMEEEILPLRRK